ILQVAGTKISSSGMTTDQYGTIVAIFQDLAKDFLSKSADGAPRYNKKELLYEMRWLPHFFCNAKLISAVDRLGKEKEGFIHHCTEAFHDL
ncbi:hypothetical protein ACJX0J_041920, partial [Zea mays]